MMQLAGLLLLLVKYKLLKLITLLVLLKQVVFLT